MATDARNGLSSLGFLAMSLVTAAAQSQRRFRLTLQSAVRITVNAGTALPRRRLSRDMRRVRRSRWEIVFPERQSALEHPGRLNMVRAITAFTHTDMGLN